MNVGLMRKLDYWLGIPLCFLFTGIDYVLSLFSFKKEKSNQLKILFIKLSEMGSIILAYPLMEKAKKEAKEAEIFFLTFKKNKPLFKILDIVPQSNILTIGDESIYLFILDTLRVISRIRKEKIGIVFDLEFFSRFTAILTYLSTAPKRIGFYHYTMEGLYRGNLLTHKVQYNPLFHISKTYLSLWQLTRIETKSTPELEEKIEDRGIFLPKIISSEERKRQLRNKLKRFGINEEARLILINPGEGSIPLREWPLENYIFLGRELLEEEKNYLVVVGTQGTPKRMDLLSNCLNNKRVIDLSNKTDLSELLTLFDIADLLLTNDSGMAHLAALTSIKKFILFGPESPLIYSPLGENARIIYSGLACSPCFSAFNHRSSACKDNKCLKMIKPDEVYELIKTFCLHPKGFGRL
jgi:ADP-heptose:LPS heptosyltransferase